MKKLRPLFKTLGGKYYLAAWIAQNFPDDFDKLKFCDLCCGGGSIFLNHHASSFELINDSDPGITSIFKSLRDDPKNFIGRLKKIQYSEGVFFKALEKQQQNDFEDYVDLAINEFILRRMSRNGLKKTFAWTNRVRGGKPGDVNAWETIIAQLPDVAKRVKDIAIINKDFKQIISAWNEDDIFLFIDPPYLPLAVDGSFDPDENEMSVEDHISFLKSINNSKSKVMIFGYDCMLYKKHLEDWEVVKKKVPNYKHKSRKYYCLWKNYKSTS